MKVFDQKKQDMKETNFESKNAGRTEDFVQRTEKTTPNPSFEALKMEKQAG